MGGGAETEKETIHTNKYNKIQYIVPTAARHAHIAKITEQ